MYKVSALIDSGCAKVSETLRRPVKKNVANLRAEVLHRLGFWASI